MPKSHGIYDGKTIGAVEYAHGRDEGRLTADALAVEGLPAWPTVGEAAAREDLDGARSERSRAYYLGWLRGFREVSR